MNPDDPEAEERSKKINEAYDRIEYEPGEVRAPGVTPDAIGRPTTPPTPVTHAGRQPLRRFRPGNPYGGGGAGGGYQYQWVEINWEDLFNTWNQALSVP